MSDSAATPAPRYLALLAGTPAPGAPLRFAFAFDGRRRLVEGRLAATPGPLTVAGEGSVTEHRLELWRGLEAMLGDLGMTLDEFSARGLLPLTFGEQRLRAAAARLALAGAAPDADDLAALTDLRDRLATRFEGIAAVLLVAAHVAGDAALWPGDATPGDAVRDIPGALAALARYVPLAEAAAADRAAAAFGILQPRLFPLVEEAVANQAAVVDFVAGLGATAPFGLPEALRRLGTQAREMAAQGTRTASVWRMEAPRAAWARWQGALWPSANLSPSARPPTAYGDVVFAARDIPPGAVFRGEWTAMTPADWAWLCALSFQPAGPAGPGEPAPGWALVVGLASLGFDRRALDLAVRRAELPEGLAGSSWYSLVPPTRDPGLLLLMRDGPGSLGEQAALPTPPALPIFPMRRARSGRYAGVVAWLIANGLVGQEVFDEQRLP